MVRTPDALEVIYLHGLGASPESVKARLVSSWCGDAGLPVTVPTLSIPSFARLSVDAVVFHVVSLIEQVSQRGSIVLVGSSFGGFAAIHAFDRLSDAQRARVKGVMLMAPVFYPWHKTRGLLTPEIEVVWREQGVFPLTESASGIEIPVHYQFLEELRRYSSDAVSLTAPTVIVHGTHDETVSHEQSVEFATKQGHPQLVLLEDNHQLVAYPERLRALFDEVIQRAR